MTGSGLRQVVGTTCIVLAMILCASRQVRASNLSAHQLVYHLYIVNGQMPIQTLIVDNDVSGLINPKEKSGNLRPDSHDKIFFKSPNKLHVDSILIDPGGPFDGKQFVFIRDGVNRWMFVTTGEYPVQKGPDQPQATSMLPFHIQTYPQDASKQYTVIKRDDRTYGTPADVVRISDPGNPRSFVTVWIDTTRWVPLAQELGIPSVRPGVPDVLKKIIYQDFRRLPDGRFFPFRLDIYKNGVLETVCTYTAVGVNDNLPDSLFEPMKRFLK